MRICPVLHNCEREIQWMENSHTMMKTICGFSKAIWINFHEIYRAYDANCYLLGRYLMIFWNRMNQKHALHFYSYTHFSWGRKIAEIGMCVCLSKGTHSGDNNNNNTWIHSISYIILILTFVSLFPPIFDYFSALISHYIWRCFQKRKSEKMTDSHLL